MDIVSLGAIGLGFDQDLAYDWQRVYHITGLVDSNSLAFGIIPVNCVAGLDYQRGEFRGSKTHPTKNPSDDPYSETHLTLVGYSI